LKHGPETSTAGRDVTRRGAAANDRFWPFSAIGAALNCPVGSSVNCQEAEGGPLQGLRAVDDPYRYLRLTESCFAKKVTVNDKHALAAKLN
jgi:hypothetical protein